VGDGGLPADAGTNPDVSLGSVSCDAVRNWAAVGAIA
jgi:hypothetical protein